MYLKQLHVENNGPLVQLAFELPFAADGSPQPLVLVGANGSGKTNLQSIVADALFEAATRHYTNVVPGMTRFSHDWFRVGGGHVTTFGKAYQFSVLKFEHDSKTYWFQEKHGTLSPGDGMKAVGEALQAGVSWQVDAPMKQFTLDDPTAEKIFEAGAYVYFSSSRAEYPHWLNREVAPREFDISARFSKRLRKPIFVERSLHDFAQWILSVVSDGRIDVQAAFQVLSLAAMQAQGEQPQAFTMPAGVMTATQAQSALLTANEILRAVLDEPSAHFVWLGRHNPLKLGIAKAGQLALQGLESLSLGQATLLGVFGTLLRYGDDPQWNGALRASDITGICIVDEIDAHMHVDLQQRTLPKLIRMFPKVQFILSSHSPLFVLGMEREFGSDGVRFIDLPSGANIQAEAYSEFARAFDTLKQTKAFDAAIGEAASQGGKPIVFVEGETDPIYICAAAELLERQTVVTSVELKWIGAKNESGNAFFTGAGALDHTLRFLQANPSFVKRRIVLLYDNDKNKKDEQLGEIRVRAIPTNPENSKIKNGIENLLPESVLTDEMYLEKVTDHDNGTTVTRREPLKMKLCKHLCETKRDASDFAKFGLVLDLIESATK